MTPHQRTPDIIREVAGRHGMTVGIVLSPRRSRRVVRCRYEAIRAVHEAKPHLSSPELGQIFGRDHTTILYALGRIGRKYPTV